MKTYPTGSKAKIHLFRPNHCSQSCLLGRAFCEWQLKKNVFILVVRGHYSSQSYLLRGGIETGTAQSTSTSESIRKGTGNVNDLWVCVRRLFDQILA